MEFKKTSAFLAESDKLILKKQAYMGIVLPVILCLFVGTIAFSFMAIMGQGLFAWLALAVAVLVCAVIVMLSLQSTSLLNNHKKTIVTGIITDKFKKLGSTGVSMAGTGDHGNQVYNYLQFGDYKLRVEDFIYKKYKKGDAVELHFVEKKESQPVPSFISHKKLS